MKLSVDGATDVNLNFLKKGSCNLKVKKRPSI